MKRAHIQTSTFMDVPRVGILLTQLKLCFSEIPIAIKNRPNPKNGQGKKEPLTQDKLVFLWTIWKVENISSYNIDCDLRAKQTFNFGAKIQIKFFWWFSKTLIITKDVHCALCRLGHLTKHFLVSYQNYAVFARGLDEGPEPLTGFLVILLSRRS